LYFVTIVFIIWYYPVCTLVYFDTVRLKGFQWHFIMTVFLISLFIF